MNSDLEITVRARLIERVVEAHWRTNKSTERSLQETHSAYMVVGGFQRYLVADGEGIKYDN